MGKLIEKAAGLSLILILAICCSAIAQEWEIAGSMPVPVASGKALNLDGRIYILGGLRDDGSLCDLVQIYDPANGAWLQPDQMPEGRSGFSAVLNGRELLVMGGMAATLAQSERLQGWDLASWRTLREHRYFDRTDGSAVLLGDRLILFGGYPVPFSSLSTTTPFVAEYDLSANSFVHADSASFPGEAPYNLMTAVLQSQVYLFGGAQFGISNKCYRYDPYDHSLTRLQPNLLRPRAGGEAIRTGSDRIYLLGGYNESQNALASVEIVRIDAGTLTLENGPAMRYPRRTCLAAAAGDYLYVFGGYDERGYIPAEFERLLLKPNTVVENKPAALREFRLTGSYPNPFNSRTVISFSLDRPAEVVLAIHATDGRQVKSLFAGRLASGAHRVVWDGTDDANNPLPSGLYFGRLTTSGGTAVQKMTLIR
jgi:hypothetical protein